MHSERTRWSWKSFITAVACMGLVFGMQLAAPPAARATTGGTVTITGTVAGAPVTSTTLTASPSGFAEAPSRYAWYTYAEASGGSGTWVADGQTYVPVGTDIGKYILVIAYTSTGDVPSPRVGPIVPLQVSISGAAKVGQTLSTSQTGFTADVTVTWRSPTGDVMMPEQLGTGATYQIKEADLGKYIYAQVEDNIIPGWVKESSQVGPVTADITAGTPVILGTAQAGATLYAVYGDGWSPAPESFTYQWLSDGSVITGATFDTYVLTAANVGHQISVRVTGSKTGYNAASATSQKTVKVLAAPVATLGTPVARSVAIRSGSCVVVPVSVEYQVPAKLADSLSSVKVATAVTNYKGVKIATVSMATTATRVSGTLTGKFRWCSGAGLGKVTFGKPTGTWTGTHQVVDASRPLPRPASGVFSSTSAAKIRVRAAVRFVDRELTVKGAAKSLNVKFQAYRPGSQRWSGVARGVRVSVQKQVGSRWVTVDTAATANTAGKVSFAWRAKGKATYRLVWAGSGTKKATVSPTFSG